MTRSGFWSRLAFVALLAGLLVGTTWWSLPAQERTAPSTAPAPSTRRPKAEPVPERPARPRAEASTSSPKPVSIQDALLKKCKLPFGRGVALEDLAVFLREATGAQVALDYGALDRQDVQPEDVVLLELENVRLKTGLKLLLDQLNLTYKVVPEDNLLIITDARESEEAYTQILGELDSLHRDIHKLEDMMDELLDREDLGPLPDAHARHISRQVSRLRRGPVR